VKSWEKQEGEPDTAYAHFLAFLTLGVGRTIIRAYKLTHPDSEAAAVSGVWRDESGRWSWRKRANDHDLSLFREVARESVAVYGEAIRHLGVKALEAMASEKPEMRPLNWEQALGTFSFLRSLFPTETIVAFVDHADKQGDPPNGKQAGPQYGPEDIDEDGFLRERPESYFEARDAQRVQEEVDRVRTGEIPIYRRETYTPPAAPPRQFGDATPPTPPAK
jgi:hypothetical protein